MVAKKKSKNVISQHTNKYTHATYTNILFTHTYCRMPACMHVERIAIAFAFINTKKIHFFQKMQPCAALQTRKWHDDDVNGNSVRVCVRIFITHTHKHTDTIHKRTAAAHVSQYIQRHSHTHIQIYHRRSHSHTHTLVRGTHSHWHRPQSHLIILY